VAETLQERPEALPYLVPALDVPSLAALTAAALALLEEDENSFFLLV